jgi:hypothetical protein
MRRLVEGPSKTASLVALALALSLQATALAFAQEPPKGEPVQAASLIGEWWGEVVGSSYSWKVYLTFKTVQDSNKLLGVVYVVAPTTGSGTTYANRDHAITAILDKDALSFAIPDGPQFWLTVSGKTMSGTTRGIRITASATFTKVK